jgi:TetR/AcrR family transcriptional repressor of lmrAB and yxaGH operons
MAHPQLPRDEVIDRLTAVFRREGYEGASLALLSEATGLGRSSLYHHFPRGKEDMAEAVMLAARERLTNLVLERLAGPGSPRQRLEAAVRGWDEFYHSGQASCLTELFSVGSAKARFQNQLLSGVSRTRAAIAEVLIEAGLPRETAEKRALDALVTIQGGLVVGRASNDPAIFQSVLAALPDRLLGA